ncbi:MAG: cytochrome c [Gemmatimonadota bacterium]|nr:cytochrome c [Gemmatimonadota bacterium]
MAPLAHPQTVRLRRRPVLRRATRALAVALAGALGAGVLLPGSTRAQGPAMPDPAAQQIDIGQQWFRARCVECHEKGDLTNANFQLKWSGQSALDLVDLIQRTMPDDEPGALTRGTYVAIVTYLMKLNGMSAGTAMLASDSTALRGVRLEFARTAAQTPPH